MTWLGASSGCTSSCIPEHVWPGFKIPVEVASQIKTDKSVVYAGDLDSAKATHSSRRAKNASFSDGDKFEKTI